MRPLTACKHLQNKAFFFPPPVEGYDEELGLRTPCWCIRTHQPVGPDGGEASLERCDKSRTCFQPAVQL